MTACNKKAVLHRFFRNALLDKTVLNSHNKRADIRMFEDIYLEGDVSCRDYPFFLFRDAYQLYLRGSLLKINHYIWSCTMHKS